MGTAFRRSPSLCPLQCPILVDTRTCRTQSSNSTTWLPIGRKVLTAQSTLSDRVGSADRTRRASALLQPTSALRLGLTSNGSLGAVDWADGYYRHYLNTDNLSIDVYTGAGGYVTGAQVARLVAQPGGPDVAVFDFTTFILGSGVDVYVVGSRPAAILATGTITIAGTIYVQNGYAGRCRAGERRGRARGPGQLLRHPARGAPDPGTTSTIDSGGFTVYEPLTGGGGGGGGSGVPGQAGYPTKTLVDIHPGPQVAGRRRARRELIPPIVERQHPPGRERRWRRRQQADVGPGRTALRRSCRRCGRRRAAD